MNNLQPLNFHSNPACRTFDKRVQDGVSECAVLVLDPQKLCPFMIKRMVPEYISGEPPHHAITEVTATNRKTGEIHDILQYLSFKNYRVNEVEDGQQPDIITYEGNSEIAPLKRGTYSIYVKDALGNEFWSDYFKVAFTNRPISFEYYSDQDISYLPFTKGFRPKFTLHESFIVDTGDIHSYKEVTEDHEKNEYTTFERMAGLFEAILCANTPIRITCNFMKMCDHVFITDNTGQRREVEITNVNPSRIEGTDYLEVRVKFYYKDDLIITGDNLSISTTHQQKGANYIPNKVWFTAPDNKAILTKGGKKIIFPK